MAASVRAVLPLLRPWTPWKRTYTVKHRRNSMKMLDINHSFPWRVWTRGFSSGSTSYQSRYNPIVKLNELAGKVETERDLVAIENFMKRNQFKKRSLAIRTYLKACANVGSMDAAEWTFELLVKEGTLPNGRVYGKLIKAGARAKNPSRAKYWKDELLKAAKKWGWPLEWCSIAFESYIFCLSRTGDVEQVMAAIEEMKALGCKPSSATLNSVLTCYMLTNQYMSAIHAFEHSHKLGIEIDQGNVRLALKALNRAKLPDRAIELFKRIKSEGKVKLSGQAYSMYATSLQMSGDYEQLDKVLDSLKTLKLKVPRTIVSVHVKALIAQGRYDEAFKRYSSNPIASPAFVQELLAQGSVERAESLISKSHSILAETTKDHKAKGILLLSVSILMQYLAHSSDRAKLLEYYNKYRGLAKVVNQKRDHPICLAMYLIKLQDTELAEKALSEAREDDMCSALLLMAYLDCMQKAGNIDKAEEAWKWTRNQDRRNPVLLQKYLRILCLKELWEKVIEMSTEAEKDGTIHRSTYPKILALFNLKRYQEVTEILPEFLDKSENVNDFLDNVIRSHTDSSTTILASIVKNPKTIVYYPRVISRLIHVGRISVLRRVLEESWNAGEKKTAHMKRVLRLCLSSEKKEADELATAIFENWVKERRKASKALAAIFDDLWSDTSKKRLHAAAMKLSEEDLKERKLDTKGILILRNQRQKRDREYSEVVAFLKHLL
ncbi:hypothetical protein AAMO2058_000451600 [Amorphochlora amoebiformis]